MNVVIVHGSNEKDRENMKRYNLLPQNERGWLGWIKEKLEEKGIKCFNPLMPENWNPNYKKWKKEFEKINVDENSILIGHSAGGGFLVRWLGETKKKVKKLILIAPAIAHSLEEGWEINEFYKFKINKDIKNYIEKIILIESSNDSEGLKKAGKIFSRDLGIKPIILKDKGHFTEKGMKTKEFPELLNEILS